MRLIAQISDLHFGYNDPLLLDRLRDKLIELKPDVLVISGDLVEHATDSEFQSARDYIQSLPRPQIVVPGNHDLPFYNLFRRALEGLSKFHKYITPETEPFFRDDEIAVVGADSAHLYPVKGGKITGHQLTDIVGRFSSFPDTLVRVLVTHHPFDLPELSNRHLLIGESRRAVTLLAPVVDILFAGHVHLSSSGSTSTRYKSEGHAMVFVQAGTAVSNRNKGEANSFNVVRTGVNQSSNKEITVQRYAWVKEESAFACRDSEHFRLGTQGWAHLTESVVKPQPAGL